MGAVMPTKCRKVREDETMDLRIDVKDKVFLGSILKGGFTFPYEGISASQLAFSLMTNFKSIDPKLRDELSYSMQTERYCRRT